MQNITEEESLLLQCLSTTSLLGALSCANFFESDYFKTLNFANKECKEILIQSGLGNPATMQMMLYALLTVPREILSRTAYSELEIYYTRINPLAYTLVEADTHSSYNNEESKENIDYFRHIINAVAHSKCEYLRNNHTNYVIFTDNNAGNTKQCSIKMECHKIGYILMELQILIMEYYNNKHNR